MKRIDREWDQFKLTAQKNNDLLKIKKRPFARKAALNVFTTE
ncbi:MAG: hypothetical protein ACYDA4_04870 [Ignavibacteriaceae bacterium]